MTLREEALATPGGQAGMLTMTEAVALVVVLPMEMPKDMAGHMAMGVGVVMDLAVKA